MSVLACLWIRPRLERYADGALGARSARSVAAHISGCAPCMQHVERQTRLQSLIRSTLPEPAELEWAGFWPGIESRIAREAPRAMRDPWWIPLWKPFWGHPRVALGSALAAGLLLTLSLWPVGDRQSAVAWAGPVVVHDVSTPDPDQSVMVYSSPDQSLTVIWLFSAGASTDES